MPQRIPLEASEVLTFTPECFAEHENPPTFRLRAATQREKRYMRDLLREEGATEYSVQQLREEFLNGLREAWDEETFAEKAPIIEAYWQASDDFALQQRDDPELAWSYDNEIERQVRQLEHDMRQAWRPLGKMYAANARTGELTTLAIVAAVVIGWDGFDLRMKRARGYLTIDGADELREKVIETANRSEDVALPFRQLVAACTSRMFLDKAEAGNCDAGSPSVTPPLNSKTGDAESGPSPKSAPSTQTPGNS